MKRQTGRISGRQKRELDRIKSLSPNLAHTAWLADFVGQSLSLSRSAILSVDDWDEEAERCILCGDLRAGFCCAVAYLAGIAALL